MSAARHAPARAARASATATIVGLLVVGCGGSGKPHHTRSTTTATTPSPPSRTASKCDFKVSRARVRDGYHGLIFETRYGSKTGVAAIRGCWQNVQVPTSSGRKQLSRIRLVNAPGSRTDPYRPSGSVMRVELRPFDHGAFHGDVTTTGNYHASRAEVYARFGGPGVPAAQWPDPVGSTRWYAWSFYLPPDFALSAAVNHWLDLTQWKGEYSGSPAVAVGVVGHKLVLHGKYATRPLARVTRGRWMSLRIGIHFSPVKSVGWVAAAVDGRTVLPRTHAVTMNEYSKDGQLTVDPSYFKQGIYRSDTWQQTQVAYFGPVKIGTTPASVG